MKVSFISIGLLVLTLAKAQSIEQNVVASSGNSVSAGSVTLDYTLGELYIGNVTSGSVVLSSGFHQYFGSGIGINEFVGAQLITLYPVPTYNFITIQLPEFLADGASMWLTNAGGQRVSIGGNSVIAAAGATTHLDLQSLPSGVYFLFVTHPKLKEVEVYRLTKVI